MKSKEFKKSPSLDFPQARIVEDFSAQIKFSDTGKRVQVSRGEDGTILTVNTSRFASEEEAQREALVQTGYHQVLQESLTQNPKAFLVAVKKTPGLLKGLSYQGAGLFKTEDGAFDQIMTHKPEFAHLGDEFKWACQYYVSQGEFPEDLSPEVQKIIKKMPRKGGKLPLDYLASDGTSLKVKGKMYDKYIKPALENLSGIKQESQDTKSDEYVPPLESNSETLEEGQIENKVYDFWGGYYRGQVFTFDPAQRKLIAPSVSKSVFTPRQLPENLDTHKTYTYKGTFDPSKPENIIPLPHKEGKIALPIPTTLSPQANFKLMRDERGTFSMEAKEAVSQKTPFEFEFILLSTEDNRLTDAPVSENTVVSGDPKPNQVLQFLQDIQGKKLSEADKIQRCLGFVHKHLRYPEPGEFEAMDQRFAKAGDQLFSEIVDHGITDCHWGNIFFGELLKNLGLAHRVPAGFYIEKDLRFDFAALAGTGHTWSEVWDGNEWVRHDGTPPKQKQDEKEEPDEDSEDQEGDFSGTPEKQEELTLEEIEAMYEDLIGEAPEEETEKDIAEDLFTQKKGVELSQWRQVERFIDQTNNTPIDAEWSVSGKPSTLQQEWRSLFDLIYKRREAPVIKFRGPVRQSEGDSLDDPVDAYIDIRSGESDPLGFKVEETKIKESVDATEFEDDSILDLTASMFGDPVAEQKKMILSAGFNLMQLNRKLNLSTHRSKLKTPIQLKSRIASFQGSTDTSLHHTSDQSMDERSLTHLYYALDNMQGGAGDLKKALQEYRASLDPETLRKIRDKKLVKILTVISDGGVGGRSEAPRIIKDLRDNGIVVQGIGFGMAAQDIRVICNDPEHPDAGVVLNDVSQAVLVRHAMLSKHLKEI